MTDQTGTSLADTIGADINAALPTISVLAKTFAGSIYTKVLGTIGEINDFSAEHPYIREAVDAMALALGNLFPGLQPALRFIPLAETVLGEFGALAARDATVQGPQFGASRAAPATT